MTSFSRMTTVCIIDDDPIHQRIAQILIEKNQIFDKVIPFQAAECALEYFAANSTDPENLPETILLDLNMPNMDGWDFLEAFKTIDGEISKPVNIFIVTSSVDEKDKVRSQTFSSVKGFISKPLTKEIILSTKI